MRSLLVLALAFSPSAFALPAWQTRLRNPLPSLSVSELSLDEWSSVHKAISYKAWRFLDSVWYLDSQDSTDDESILDVIKGDPQFSRLSKLLDIDKETSDVLSDKSAGLTFFAPNDDALRRHDDDSFPEYSPCKRKVSCSKRNSETLSLSYLSGVLEELGPQSYNDDDDKKKRRERFKKILHKVLQYHILPIALDNNLLSDNTTFATTMTAPHGAFDGQPQRIRTEWTLVPPGLEINFETRVVKSDVKAANGYVHIIDSPLIPRKSILDQLFLYPEDFSTATSLLQKVELDYEIQFQYVRKDKGKGVVVKGDGPAVTMFVPNNEAFDALPEKMRFWLFSPAGENALRKILKFHIVPEYIVHVDWQHDASSDSSVRAPDDEPESKIVVPSLLRDHNLEIAIVKPSIPLPGRYKRRIVVNGQEVVEQDATALNGASHVIGTLLDPRSAQPEPGPGVTIGSWDDWEKWLPAWAERD